MHQQGSGVGCGGGGSGAEGWEEGWGLYQHRYTKIIRPNGGRQASESNKNLTQNWRPVDMNLYVVCLQYKTDECRTLQHVYPLHVYS